MSQPRSLQSLADKAAPTFEQPFEMMQACHERLDRTLALLRKLREHVAAHGADEQARQAAADVMRYFDQAAPNHHRDEELHVFPPLLAQGRPATVAAVRRLQQDHEAMEGGWERARHLLAQLQGGALQRFDAPQEATLDEFAALYARHIELEESLAYPEARSMLGEEELRAMGAEMKRRRGG